MEAYYAQFNNNETPVNREWSIYKTAHYPYDEHVNYYDRVMVDEKAAYKRGDYDYGGRQMEVTAFDAFMKHHYFGQQEYGDGTVSKSLSPKEVNKKCYDNWIMFRKKQFVKDWKPVTYDQGLNYYWITLNFKPETSISKVKPLVDKFCNLSIFENSCIRYCYEYYTKTGHHPHVHMLVELSRTGTIKPSDVVQKAFQISGWKSVMGNPEQIDIKFSKGKDKKRARPRAELDAYLAGKKGNKKKSNCALDKAFRLANSLENLYVISRV